MVEPFFDRSKAIYREGLYRSLEIFSNHVNNSGGCTHNPAEHSPTTTPSLPLQRCVVISHCRYRFHGWQRNLEAGIVAGNPPPQIPLVVCARFAEERRRIRAGRLIRPPTKILGRRFTRNRSLHSTPRLLHPPRLGGERTTARFVSLPFFLSLSLPVRSYSPISLFPSLPRPLAEVGSRRLNLILNHSAAFTRYRDVTREREGQRNGNFDVGSIATWINCFLATDRVDRSMKLIERIPSAANFFLEPRWRLRDPRNGSVCCLRL